jgi:hypothetical protein
LLYLLTTAVEYGRRCWQQQLSTRLLVHEVKDDLRLGTLHEELTRTRGTTPACLYREDFGTVRIATRARMLSNQQLLLTKLMFYRRSHLNGNNATWAPSLNKAIDCLDTPRLHGPASPVQEDTHDES